MKKFKKFASKALQVLLALVLGMVYIYVCLSLAWSWEELSAVEKALVVAYLFCVLPLYYMVKGWIVEALEGGPRENAR